MANHNSSSKEIPSAILVENPVPCHRYDNWLIPEANSNRNAHFASTVVDVSRGAKAIAGILAAHLVDLEAIRDGCKTTRLLFSANDTEALARLAVFSLSQLHEIAVDQVDSFNADSGEGASK
jgi:hypothetical protein